MAYENPSVQERSRLYRERPSSNLDPLINELKNLESGKSPRIELSEQEKAELLEFEAKLGEALENIEFIKVNEVLLYPEYFLTPQGKEEFKKTANWEIRGDTIDEVIKEIMLNRERLVKGKEYDELKELSSNSIDFEDRKILDAFESAVDENGEIGNLKAENPKRNILLYNVKEAIKKINALRQFRRQLKEVRNSLGKKNVGFPDNLTKAKLVILELYRRKLNIFILSQTANPNYIRDLVDVVGIENLTEEEKELLQAYYGEHWSGPTGERRDQMASIADKIIRGTSTDLDEKGNYKQIGEDLQVYADRIEEEYFRNELLKNEELEKRGLDPEKVLAENVTGETMAEFMEELLEVHNQKSRYPSSEFDSSRERSAPDGKWQAVAMKKFKKGSVESKQKVIEIPLINRTIIGTLGVLAHEYVHFLQALNRSLIPLRLFKEIGGDRAGIFGEGGSMEAQNHVQKEIFGIESIPHPHYIRAMAARLSGGNYLECVKAFYNSELGILRRKKPSGKFDRKELRSLIKQAINRTKRLFRGGAVDFTSESGFLTNSKDTVYLEQRKLLDKLRGVNLEKYALMGGANLQTLIILTEVGLIDPEEIQGPRYDVIFRIWDRIKDQYKK